MYTATYSPDDNKLRLYAATRLDPETYAKVRAAGFIWAPKQGLFVAPMWTPSREDLLLDLCGEIGDEDTSLVDRAEARAERFDGYRESRTADAESARRAVSAIADNIPLGQPILVGHHSERRARKDAERIETGMRKAVRMWDTAQYWQSRAAGALGHAKYKELPTVRARRIKTLEAERRKRQRQQDESKRLIGLWGQLNNPYLGEELRPGVRSMDRRPCDDALRMRRATQIANLDHVSILKPGTDQYSSLWSELTAGRITPRDAQLRALKAHGRGIAYARRWLVHLDHRLAYERAMLNEQGAAHLLAPKPRSIKAQLPICNYRAPGGLEIENLYHRGQMMHYPQVEMTQAEYAAINQDYKGTRVVDHSHRVRTTMQRHSLVCVFLTDAKVHEKPKPKDAPTPARRMPVQDLAADTERLRAANDARAIAQAEAAPFEALRTAARTGVQVVSAPQLFPTPPDVARQVVALAEIQSGECVLEPSAGTGNLVQAVIDSGVDTEILAYEINASLCSALARKYPSYRVQARCADFLTVTDFQGQYPKIIMNPPFERGADIRHITHARTFLAPGGRLVAICADGPRQRAAFHDDADAWIELPAGTFEGTNVRAAIVVLSK